MFRSGTLFLCTHYYILNYETPQRCHCEEISDEAISPLGYRLPRPQNGARNDIREVSFVIQGIILYHTPMLSLIMRSEMKAYFYFVRTITILTRNIFYMKNIQIASQYRRKQRYAVKKEDA